ncbi:2,3-bisphosphoglycerate-independent phosphoglycerate mutase [Gorgonomyces haynaldii]|nr:2,3-bisphosphoglycerate-independent phosphoglycerate mutase [Gorgonomyces haynaldii]
MQKACLICIDGWGFSTNPSPAGDAIRNAKTPVMTDLHKKYPNVPLSAHGLSVGLPDGLMGNSEVGHLNIGAGRVVYQDIVRIELAIKNDQLDKQQAVIDCFQRAKNGNGRLHFMGLVSDGGVHSHVLHLIKYLKDAKRAGVPEAFVHVFGDGRDTAPRSILGYLKTLQDAIDAIKFGKIATICGRYYAMDRDKRWERVKIAYEGLVQGLGEQTQDYRQTIEARYQKDETDEFLKPIIVDQTGTINDNDTILCFNFRSDRMREISQALGIAPLPFETAKVPKNLGITTMTQYKSEFPFPVVFPPQVMDNVLAEWIAKQKLRQMHVAETEKFAHVTFFFNGGIEKEYENEERSLVPSPKVATYDLKPEMSAIEVAEKVAEHLQSQKYEFVMCNFANPDMVGHTGVYEAAIKGVEATDKGIGIIYEACQKAGYTLFVTADHGNAEQMFGEGGQPHTAHTCNKVPFVMTSTAKKLKQDPEAALCDVAPTILDFMGLSIPKEMTGKSLLQ